MDWHLDSVTSTPCISSLEALELGIDLFMQVSGISGADVPPLVSIRLTKPSLNGILSAARDAQATGRTSTYNYDGYTSVISPGYPPFRHSWDLDITATSFRLRISGNDRGCAGRTACVDLQNLAEIMSNDPASPSPRSLEDIGPGRWFGRSLLWSDDMESLIHAVGGVHPKLAALQTSFDLAAQIAASQSSGTQTLAVKSRRRNTI